MAIGTIVCIGLSTSARWVDGIIVEVYTDSTMTNKVTSGTSGVTWDGQNNNQKDLITLAGLTAGQQYFLRGGVTSPVTAYTTWTTAADVVAGSEFAPGTFPPGSGGGGGTTGTGADKCCDCIDPRAYGAKGDGVNDDTAAIQAALDVAGKNAAALLSFFRGETAGGGSDISGPPGSQGTTPDGGIGGGIPTGGLGGGISTGGLGNPPIGIPPSPGESPGGGGSIYPDLPNACLTTKVCINACMVCRVTPQILDSFSVTFDPHGGGCGGMNTTGGFAQSAVCLFIDSGVRLVIDGTVRLDAPVNNAITNFPYTIIENRHASTGTPHDDHILIYGTGKIDANENSTQPGWAGRNWAKGTAKQGAVIAIRFYYCDYSTVKDITFRNVDGCAVELGESSYSVVRNVQVNYVTPAAHCGYSCYLLVSDHNTDCQFIGNMIAPEINITNTFSQNVSFQSWAALAERESSGTIWQDNTCATHMTGMQVTSSGLEFTPPPGGGTYVGDLVISDNSFRLISDFTGISQWGIGIWVYAWNTEVMSGIQVLNNRVTGYEIGFPIDGPSFSGTIYALRQCTVAYNLFDSCTIGIGDASSNQQHQLVVMFNYFVNCTTNMDYGWMYDFLPTDAPNTSKCLVYNPSIDQRLYRTFSDGRSTNTTAYAAPQGGAASLPYYVSTPNPIRQNSNTTTISLADPFTVDFPHIQYTYNPNNNVQHHSYDSLDYSPSTHFGNTFNPGSYGTYWIYVDDAQIDDNTPTHYQEDKRFYGITNDESVLYKYPNRVIIGLITTNAHGGALGVGGGNGKRAAQPYDMGISLGGNFTINQVLVEYPFPRPVTFPDSFAGSIGSLNTAPSVSLVVTFYKNGSSIGTATFTASTTAVFATTAGTTFATGDILRAVVTTTDTNAKDIGFSLTGYRS